jgi:hypothetical protein
VFARENVLVPLQRLRKRVILEPVGQLQPALIAGVGI